MLTKVHEEMQPQFKQFYQQLNSLSIERSLPKTKPHNSMCVLPLFATLRDIPPTAGIGQKTGRLHCVVQAREGVQQLYKTSKRMRGIQTSAKSPIEMQLINMGSGWQTLSMY